MSLSGYPAGRAKPLIFSRLQSILGFTGVYFPFTGEANVNVDAPACLIPATIAHEMAHQRMVASELEANFVGIAACVTCGDVVFQYSGYLMGLIQLCNALYPVDGGGVAGHCTTTYWAALQSPVEDAAGQVYDTFLKGQRPERWASGPMGPAWTCWSPISARRRGWPPPPCKMA
ncbi:MAG: DUF3810 family protein [Lawsonibacter sp.]